MVKHKIMKKIMETEELSLKTISHKATPKHLSFGRIFFGSECFGWLGCPVVLTKAKTSASHKSFGHQTAIFSTIQCFVYIFSYQFMFWYLFWGGTGWDRKKVVLQKNSQVLSCFFPNSRSRRLDSGLCKSMGLRGWEFCWFDYEGMIQS